MSAVKMGLTIEEAAECTGIGRNTMRKLVEWGKLPGPSRRTRPSSSAGPQCGCRTGASSPIPAPKTSPSLRWRLQADGP